MVQDVGPGEEAMEQCIAEQSLLCIGCHDTIQEAVEGFPALFIFPVAVAHELENILIGIAGEIWKEIDCVHVRATC